MDTCTNAPMQQLVADYLADGRLDAHLDTLRSVYRERKQAMRAALADAFGEQVIATTAAGSSCG